MQNQQAVTGRPERNVKISSRFRRLYPWLLCIGAGLVMYLRAPNFFHQPRIWAEEGTAYIAYAYKHTFWQALIAPHQGYYGFFPNVASILALQAGVENAPVVTTWFSFLAQMVPVALAAWGASSVLDRWYKRLLGVAVVLLAASSGEVWLNTINAQFHWNVAAALILLEDTRPLGRLRRWLYMAVLLIAGLTGMVSCFLLPAFVLRAVWSRDRDNTLQALVLAVCSLLQGWAWWTTRESGIALTARLSSLDFPSLIAVLFNRTMIAPLLGQSLAGVTASWLARLRAAGALAFSGLAVVVFLGMAILFTLLCWRNRRRSVPLLLGYLLVTALSIVSALVPPGEPKFTLVYPGGAIRYFYAPSVMFLWLVLSNLELPALRQGWLTWLSCILLACGLVSGAVHYRRDIEQFRGVNWPDWRWEVARWRANPNRELLIWPPPWKMKLEK